MRKPKACGKRNGIKNGKKFGGKKVSLDTHVLYWFLEDPGKLSPITKKILEDHPKLVISVIVLFELLYMEKKSGGRISVLEIIKRLESYDHEVVPVDEKVFDKARKIKKDLDLHDRIIVATALLTNTLLMTKDEQILKSKAVKAVW